MNIRQTANMLQISIRTLRRYVAQGAPCERSGNELSFDAEQIRLWMSKPHSKRKLKTYRIFDRDGDLISTVTGSPAAFKALMTAIDHDPFSRRADSLSPYALDADGRAYVAHCSRLRRYDPAIHRQIEDSDTGTRPEPDQNSTALLDVNSRNNTGDPGNIRRTRKSRPVKKSGSRQRRSGG